MPVCYALLTYTCQSSWLPSALPCRCVLPRSTCAPTCCGGATTTPNFGVDIAVAPRFSAGASLGYNAFNFPNRLTADGRDANPKLHHWAVAAQGDYWFGHALRGPYAGVHIFGGEFNIGGLRWPNFLSRGRYEGYAVGAGLHGGYRLSLGPRWGLDLALGLGYARLNYTEYECGACGKARGRRHHNYVGPTSASVSFIYGEFI